MKKSRILACLLALTLLLGLLPLSAMAADTFGYRSVMYDGNGNPYINQNELLQTTIYLEPGFSQHVGFFLDGTLCTPSDIWVEDENVASVSPLEEGSRQYYRVEALTFDETTLHVTVDGEVYSLPISVTLPSSGFSSSEKLSEETYLTRFTFTESNRSFYFVTDKNVYTDLTKVSPTVNAEYNLVTCEKVSEHVLRLTVSASASFSDEWLNLECTWNGEMIQNYSIRLLNGTPQLVFCPVNGSEDAYTLPDLLWAYSWEFPIDVMCYGVFGVLIAGEIQPISPDEVIVTGNAASVSKVGTADGYPVYELSCNGFGEAELTVSADDETYTQSFSIILRDSGFSSAPTLTEKTYLSSFTFDAENRELYLIPEEDVQVDASTVSITVNGEPVSGIDWELLEGNVFHLTISEEATFSGGWLQVEFLGNYDKLRSYGISVVNGTPRLVLCPVDWNGNDYALPESLWAYDGEYTLGFVLDGVFGWMSGGEIELLSPGEVTVEGDTVSIYQFGEVEGYPIYSLSLDHLGAAHVSVGEYSMDLNVELPACGYYESQNRSEESFCFYCNYYETSTIWALTEDGFTEAQKETVTVFIKNKTAGVEWVKRENGNYDLKIILPEPEYLMDGYRLNVSEGGHILASIDVSARPINVAAYFTLGSKTYGVGFTYTIDDITRIYEDEVYSGFTTSDPRGETRTAWCSFPVEAGLQIIDENRGIYYDVEKAAPVSVEVNRLWLEPIFGAEDTFSWSATEDVMTTEDLDAILYFHEGADATARIWANVTCTVGGEEYIRDVCCIVQVIYKQTQTINLSGIQNTEDLNQKLAELAETIPANSTTQIFLGNDNGNPMTFQGTVEIPDAFTGDKELILHCNNVTIEGSLNLNSANVISIDGIDFIGEKTPGVSAIYGSTCCWIENCSFTHYDVALASDENGNLNPVRCTFVDNNIAASVDVDNLLWDMSLKTWEGNLFQNNGTAVKIESFNGFLSPYQFRVTNSDFIGNGVDFDVDCAATLYFYQNFYGELTNSGDVADAKHTPPTVECDHSITKVITNPRWKEPVLAWENRPVTFSLLAQPETTNYLTADWNLPTEIVNEEADGLTLDAAAFQEPGEKIIDVVNQQQQYLGTWTFAGVSAVERGVFHAGLAVEQGETAITVTVHESEMLEAVPTLTVSCAFAYAEVRFDGKTVAAAIRDGKITFPVAAAGTYTITEAEAPAQVPETPKPSKPVTKPEISQEPETPSFSDVPVGAWYAEAVAYVAGQGILQGTGNGKFSPDANLTRGMMMTILARMAGVDTTGGKTWYEKALAWAVEEGISDGTHPEATITREQLVTMLHRFAGEPAAEGDLSAFTDGKTVSPWAKEAVIWAVEAGILQGSDGKLRPQAAATRAETAQLLWKHLSR